MREAKNLVYLLYTEYSMDETGKQSFLMSCNVAPGIN